MASLTITIVVSADPGENVHTRVVASGVEVREVRLMLEKAVADLQAELAALPPSHAPTPTGGSDG